MSKQAKIVASHQPHFFPWLGYLDKMAKADAFIINDVAQLEKKSPMVRNRILDCRGVERYINFAVNKADCYEVQNRQVQLSDWGATRIRLRNLLQDAYRKAAFFAEIWPQIEEILDAEYTTLLEIDMATIEWMRNCLDIHTPLILNSSLDCESGMDKSERVAIKVAAVGGTVYLSGNGARRYMDFEAFEDRNIRVVYQKFAYPVYPQFSSAAFVPNLSAMDLLFNCGIQASREIFWNNVRASGELHLCEANEAVRHS